MSINMEATHPLNFAVPLLDEPMRSNGRGSALPDMLCFWACPTLLRSEIRDFAGMLRSFV